MARETPTDLRLGTDYAYVFHIKNAAEDTSIEIAGWALSWIVKRDRSDLDANALLTITTAGGGIAIAGTFDSDPAVNTERATVTVTDTATDAIAPGMARYELKRTDAGSETVLAEGDILLIESLHDS